MLFCFSLVLLLPLYHTYSNFYKKDTAKYSVVVSSFDYSNPWLTLKSDGIISGIDVNVLGSFATAVKLSMDFIERRDLKDKEPDILIGAIYEGYLKDNENFQLSDPYGQETMVVVGPYHFFRKGGDKSNESISTLLKNKKLGTLASNRYKIVLNQMGLQDSVDVRYYNSFIQLVNDYSNSKVDVMLLSSCLRSTIKQEDLTKSLVTVYKHLPNNLYVAFNKNSDNYLQNISYFNAMIGERNKLVTCD